MIQMFEEMIVEPLPPQSPSRVIFAIIWRVKLLNAFGKSGAFVLFYVFLAPVYLILWMVWGFSKETQYLLRRDTFTQTVSF
jgi:hypothetical protein